MDTDEGGANDANEILNNSDPLNNGDDNEYHVIEYEINTNGEEDNIHEWTEHINKLKEIQMIIDDDGVKDKVDEGIYLELMNGLGELYKMYQ